MKDALSNAEGIVRLRRFAGPPREFWAALAAELKNWVGATQVCLFSRRNDGLGRWREIASSEAPGGPRPPSDVSAALAEHAVIEGLAERTLGQGAYLAVPLVSGDPEHEAVALVVFEGERDPLATERLRLVADTPAQYQAFRRFEKTEQNIEHFAHVLELAATVREQKAFRAAALYLCDQLAARFRCHPVALGWRKGDYVRLTGLSQKAGFDRKMELVAQFEAAMEECLGRNDEVLWPPSAESSAARAHDALAQVLKTGALVGVPLRDGGEIVGVLLLAREGGAFSEKELNALRLLGDHLTPVLVEKEAADAWAGARLRRWGERRARELWSLEHPWTKLGAVLLAVGCAVLFFGRMEYRVEASFVLRPEQQALLPAPFDGYVESLAYETGDRVSAGAALLSLDDSELGLRLASLQADVARFASEAERARGEGRFAEMRVAEAQKAQAEALAEQAALQLSQATLRAPFDGVLLEDGQLRERLGAPVSRGSILLRVARLDGLYVDLEVFERDVHEVALEATGEIAFASRPDTVFPIRVRRMDPAAQTRETGAVFPLEGAIECEAEDWWRPGMTGLAKIDAGRRTFFWIITHRLVDWMHMTFWL